MPITTQGIQKSTSLLCALMPSSRSGLMVLTNTVSVRPFPTMPMMASTK